MRQPNEAKIYFLIFFEPGISIYSSIVASHSCTAYLCATLQPFLLIAILENLMLDKIKNIVASSINVKQDVLQNEELLQTVQECITVIVQAFKNGNKVLFCCNAGPLQAMHSCLYKTFR